MGKGKGHIPIRTCFSCGAKKSKDRLIRLMVDEEGQIIRDHNGRGEGRGAYVCKKRSCREHLSKHKRLNKAFRSKQPISVSSALWVE